MSRFVFAMNEANMPMPEKVSVIYDGDLMIGWCQTLQEADFICDKVPRYQWEFKKSAKINLEVLLSIMCIE